MAIFDSNKKQFLTFYANLKDPVALDHSAGIEPVGFPSGATTTVKELQTAFPTGMNTAPLLAASLLKAPFRGYSNPGITPSIWAPWSSFGNDSGPYPLNTSKFQRHTGGFLGIGGTTVTYYWMGEFILAPLDGTTGATDGEGNAVSAANLANFPARHFLEGFECPGMGSSSTTIGTQVGLAISADASRHQGGLGLAQRGTITTASASLAGLGKKRVWNRIYLRLRKAPTSVSVGFWKCNGPGTGSNYGLAIDPNGHLGIYSNDGGGGGWILQHLTTTPLLTVWDGSPGATDSGWVKLDILVSLDAAAPFSVNLRVYKNGKQVGVTVNGPFGAQTEVVNVVLGNFLGTANDMYLDFDDWLSADIPERPAGTENLTGMDFLQGTKIVRIAPKGYSGAHNAAAWSTDFRALLQRGTSGVVTFDAVVQGSTSQGLLAVDTDSDLAIDADALQVGVISIQAIVHSKSGPTGADGKLGFTLNGAAPPGANILETIAEGASFFTARRTYTITPTAAVSGSAPALPDLTPIELRYEKAANAETAEVYALQAMVELVGMFGPEDYRTIGTTAPPTFPLLGIGTHNLPYKYSPWSALGAAAPISPYIVQSGTYVGNATGQDLTFRTPPNWFFVRPVTGNVGGVIWWSSMLGNVRAMAQGIEYEVVDAQEDPTFIGVQGSQDAQQQRYRIRISGTDTQLNAVGVTYQYVAVSDPGMRYMLNGVMAHKPAQASADFPLVNSDYLAQWGFFFAGDDTSAAGKRLYGKGPGSPAATIQNFDSGIGALANAITFATGKLTSQSAFHGLTGSGGYFPFALWRRSDGLKDTGEPKVVNIGTYSGDGAASRTINLAPASGMRPLFVMVFGEGLASRSYWRDPSHTGTNSSKNTGIEAATGITAGGIDQFSVGADLNANGVIYNYFVLFGGTTAGNNGWATNGEYVPVEPNSPIDGPWPDDPPASVLSDFVPPVTAISGEPDLDTTTVLSTSGSMIWGQVGGQVCELYTRGLVNRALKHLGISRRIVNLATDVTEEAYNARDVVRETINEVLRDFPWPFASAYASLALVGGTATTPVNKDWQYSYRAPNQMMFARRLVPQDDRRRAHNPKPINFRIGTDTTGPLIFSNEPIPTAGTLILEYTIRVTCPAFFGDPLFREAVAWKLAAALAMPLAKDTKKEAFALSMYRQTLYNAMVPAANEQQQNPEGPAPWIEARD